MIRGPTAAPAPPSERNQSARADFSNRNQARCSGLSSIAAEVVHVRRFH